MSIRQSVSGAFQHHKRVLLPLIYIVIGGLLLATGMFIADNKDGTAKPPVVAASRTTTTSVLGAEELTGNVYYRCDRAVGGTSAIRAHVR